MNTPFPDTFEPDLQRVLWNSRIVHHCIKSGFSLEQTLAAVVEENERLLAKLVQQESLLPKKIKAADGKVYVWHCPNDLVPLTQV